jgi:hypothetical protein
MDDMIKIGVNDAEVVEVDGKLVLKCSHCDYSFEIQPRNIDDGKNEIHLSVIEPDVLKMEKHWNEVHKDLADECRPREFIQVSEEVWKPLQIVHQIILKEDNVKYEVLWYLGTEYEKRELSGREKHMIEQNPDWVWKTESKYDRYQWKKSEEAKDSEALQSKGVKEPRRDDEWVRWTNHVSERGIDSTLRKLSDKYRFLDIRNEGDVRITKNVDGEFYTIEWNKNREVGK